MPYGKILMIDEDPHLHRLVTEYLQETGMDVHSTSRIDGYALNEAEKADVILLCNDVAGNNTGAYIANLKGSRNTPLIMLASSGEPIDSIMYFRNGADQVLAKPFNIAELALRIEALLRRVETPEEHHTTKAAFNGLSVDLKSYTVSVDGSPAELSPKEIELLFLLISHTDQTFSRSELSSRIWGRILSDNRTIAVHINRIKSKIGTYARHITAVRGVGYKFTTSASE